MAFASERGVVARAQRASQRTNPGQFEHRGIEARHREAPDLVPPRDVVHVLLGVPDEEDQSGHQVHAEPDQRERHQFVRGAHRNAPEESDQPQVEEPDDADDQREPDEVQRLARRPHPRNGHDRLR